MSKPSSRGKPLAAAQRATMLAQRPVVHVHHARRQVMRRRRRCRARCPSRCGCRSSPPAGCARGDGVEVAGEMEVDVLHRHDLRIAAAGRPALHAEARPQRGLAQADHGLLADAVQRVAEADRRGRLALAGRRRIDRGDQDQLADWPAARQAETTVLAINSAIVIGPTPPGTGVMAPACSAALA
jgi:hypothetical protein